MKWSKYPQNKPEKDGWYLTTIVSGMGTGVFRSHYSKERVYDWQDAHGMIPSESVLAFCELPEPYVEKRGRVTVSPILIAILIPFAGLGMFYLFKLFFDDFQRRE